MKNETKTSKIAILCALCTVMATPAMAAAPVRSLGGAGTYSSASSAASSKATGSAATATRAGTMRVLPTTSKVATGTNATTNSAAGTATTSTRASATPRLSIGKYLPHRVVASNGAETVGKGDLEKHLKDYEALAGQVDSLDVRVTALEEAAADGVVTDEELKEVADSVSEIEDTVGELKAAVDALPADVVGKTELQSAIDAVQEMIPSADDLASSEAVAQLQTDVSGLKTSLEDLTQSVATVESALENYVLQTEYDEHVLAMDNTIAGINDAADALALRVVALEEKTNAGVAGEQDFKDLKAAVDDLQTVVESAVAQLPADGEVAATQAQLETVQSSVNDILTQIPESGIADAGTVSGLVSGVATLEGQVATLQGEIVKYVLLSDYNARVAAVDSSILDINNAADALAARVADLESKTSGGVAGEQDFADLSAAVEELQNDLDAAVALLPTDGSAAVTQTQLTDVQNSIDAIADKIPEAGIADADTVAGLVTDVAGLQSSVDELGDALDNTVLKATYEAKVAELDQDVVDLFNMFDDYYTKEQVDQAIKNIDFSPYATVATTNALQASVDANADLIDANAANIENIQGTIGQLKPVATSGSYNDLTDTPTIPTKVEELADADKYVTMVQLNAATAAVEAELKKALEEGDFATSENLGQVSDALKELKENVYTKGQVYTQQQVNDAISAAIGDLDMSAYVTFTKLAELQLKTDENGNYIRLGELAYKDSVGASQITSINGSVIEIGTVTADKITTEDAALAMGDFAMLVSDGKGGVTWASVNLATGEDE